MEKLKAMRWGDCMELAKETCQPCQGGTPTLSGQELDALIGELKGWQVIDHHHLRKAWGFPDFQSALDWVNRAGAICEQNGHHAEFSLGWGHAEAVVYSHKVDGLTRADLVLAAKLDAAEG